MRMTFRGNNQKVLKASNKEVVLSGAAGTGKSIVCLWKLHYLCLMVPGLRCLIVRQTAVSLTSTTLVSFESKVAQEDLASGNVIFFGGSARIAASYRYYNGSTITVGGMDKPDKVMSSEYDLIFFDECTDGTIEGWEKLTTRLRNGRLPYQQIIGACNPQHPTHWIKRRGEEGRLALLSTTHADNPLYVDDRGHKTAIGESYISTLEQLTGVRRERLLYGRWAAAEGLIYEDFSDQQIVSVEGGVEGTWYWSVDFGYKNPFVFQAWVLTGDDEILLYREIYRTGLLVEDAAREILALGLPLPKTIITDHDAEGRQTLERYLGMRTVAADKRVLEGIQTTQTQMRKRDNGRYGIYFNANALVSQDRSLLTSGKPYSTLTEILGYVWDTDARGILVKEKPRKEGDHGMDAMRYVVAHLKLQAKPRVRFTDGGDDE